MRPNRGLKYRVLIEPDEDGYLAEVPALPGCISQGETRRGALEKIREAIAGYLEASRRTWTFRRLALGRRRLRCVRPRWDFRGSGTLPGRRPLHPKPDDGGR